MWESRGSELAVFAFSICPTRCEHLICSYTWLDRSYRWWFHCSQLHPTHSRPLAGVDHTRSPFQSRLYVSQTINGHVDWFVSPVTCMHPALHDGPFMHFADTQPYLLTASHGRPGMHLLKLWHSALHDRQAVHPYDIQPYMIDQACILPTHSLTW